jgi:hypothetical protein
VIEPAARTFCVILILCGVSGCAGEGREPVHPVSGQVFVKGKPAAGAQVIFYTDRKELKKPGLPIPEGKVGDDGRFQLQTYAPGDGAPTGDYRVAIIWNEVVVDDPDPESVVVRDRLGNRYAVPDKSGLVAKVAEGNNEVPPFELK